MANTIKTIEMATLLRAAIAAVVPSGTNVYARGVPHNSEGVPDANAASVERNSPLVDIIMMGRRPQQHNSVLHAYRGIIRVATQFDDDQFQANLYTIADPVETYLLLPPSLSLTLCHFDAFVVDAEPDFDQDDSVQYLEWQFSIKTRKSA